MKKFLVKVNNQQFEVELEEIKGNNITQQPVAAKAVKPAPSTNGAAVSVAGSGEKVIAPMPGNIIKVNVSKGDVVKKGQVLLVLEAMKMENEITAHADGKIADIKVEKGQCIGAGDVMVVFE